MIRVSFVGLWPNRVSLSGPQSEPGSSNEKLQIVAQILIFSDLGYDAIFEKYGDPAFECG